MKYLRHISVFKFILIAILSTTILSSSLVTAEEEEMLMGIKAILPDNQRDGVLGYFDLQVNSGEKQTIYIEVTNEKNEDILVRFIGTNAYTSPTGGIFYAEKTESPDISLLDETFALSKSISPENEVRVKANETAKVPIEVTVPDIEKGTILGGVLIEEIVKPVEEEEEVLEKDTAKFKVITKTNYAIVVQLDLPGEVSPVFSFGKAGFNPDGPKVFIEMINDAPMIQRDISGEYKVSNKDGEELFTGEFEPILMAPKTKINFPMHWNNSVLDPGKYTISITANVAGEQIVAEEDFEISGASVKEYAERTNQPIARKGGIPYWVAIVVVLVLAGGFMIWFTKKNKKNTKVEKTETEETLN